MTVSSEKGRGSTQGVVDQLGYEIVSGHPYRPDELITLDALKSGMGISRAMAREVLQVLHQKQLVAVQPRSGATVLPPARWDVFDQDVIRWRLRSAPRLQMRSLTEIRQAIEPRAAHLAAQRASADVCRDLISLSQRLRILGTDKKTFKDVGEAGEKHRGEYSEVDVEFHVTLLKGSGNEMFLALVRPITKALRFRIDQDWAGTPGRRDRTRPATGEPRPFPRLPVPASLWFHHGLAYAVDQGLPSAAEAFACAVLAEFRTGGLQDPVLRYALGHALDLLDDTGFREGDWEPFAEVITYVVDHGHAEDAEDPEDAL
jgi:DNA-binding FadR family transcriptional regulator